MYDPRRSRTGQHKPGTFDKFRRRYIYIGIVKRLSIRVRLSAIYAIILISLLCKKLRLSVYISYTKTIGCCYINTLIRYNFNVK